MFDPNLDVLAKRANTKSRWLAVCIGLLGHTLLISRGGGQIPLNIGDVYGFIAGITWAVGGAMVKR